MNVRNLRLAVVEQFEALFAHSTGTDIDLLQLSPGPLDFTSTQAVRRQIGVGIDVGSNAQSRQDALRWRDRILGELEPALEPGLEPPTPAGKATLRRNRGFRLVTDTGRFFEQYDLQDSVTVDAVTEVLGVPRGPCFTRFAPGWE